jgi:NADPH:quinone reductase-like Zn-dependent oxidoreductase
MDFPEAAAPLLVGLTAWRMLIHRAHLRAGKIKPVIDRVMPLREGKKAYRMMEEGRQLGKIVLTP